MLNTRTSSKRNSGIGAGLVALMALAISSPAAAQGLFDYQGSAWCADCHIDHYSSWLGSAHGSMVMSCEDSLKRAIPLPDGHTCEDISYVIGGNNQSTLFLDNQGYLLTSILDADGNATPGKNRWNPATRSWSDYHAGQTGIPYDCGGCHTTGWWQDRDPDTDGDLIDNQDGLPGIHGNWDLPGIGCEACHGPGFTMEVDETVALCADCHSREPADMIQASDGFVLNYQQYNEMLASPHTRFNCTTCHNPHGSGETAMNRRCETCHSGQAESYEGTRMQLAGVECVDCHMARATMSGEPVSAHEANVRTHIFRIGTDQDEQQMFTADGAYVHTDSDGAAMLNLDFACKSCHASQSTAWLAARAKNFHSSGFRITGGLSGTWWAGAQRDGEGWLIDAAANTFVAAMYTYDGAGNQAWLLGTGVAEGDMVSTQVEITDGPSFGAGYQPGQVNRNAWGTANFLFTSCTEGTVELQPNANMQARGFEAITVNIERLTEAAVSCP